MMHLRLSSRLCALPIGLTLSLGWIIILHAQAPATGGRAIQTPDSQVRCISFSPDSQVLASANFGKVRLWDVATGKEVAALDALNGGIYDVALSADGRFLAACDDKKIIRIWDARSRQEVKRIEAPEVIRYIAFAPDGAWLIGTGESVLKWTVAGNDPPALLGKPSGRMDAFAVSPDGRTIAISVEFGQNDVELWDATSGPMGRILGVEEPIHVPHADSIVFTPDSRRVAACFMGRIYTWNVDDGQLTQKLEGDSAKPIVFSPDQRFLAAGSWKANGDESVRVYDASSGAEVWASTGHPNTFWDVCFSADGKWLAAGAGDGVILLWPSPNR